jgi:hypothetical protein
MDEIQKVLVKAGRKDLAQKYYKKIAVYDGQQNKEKVDELIKKLGGGRLNEAFLDTIGDVLNLPFISDEILSQFFVDNHAFWSRDVGAFRKKGKVYLVNYKGDIVEISLIGKKKKI